MKKLVFGLALAAVACASQAHEGLFSRAGRTYLQDADQGIPSWSARFESAKGFCAREANGAVMLASSPEFLRKGASHDRQVQRTGDMQSISYRRSWEAVEMIRYALRNKGLTPVEFGGFIGAACLSAMSLVTSETDSYLDRSDVPFSQSKIASVAFLVNMEPNWLRTYLDTTTPRCESTPKIWDESKPKGGNLIYQEVYRRINEPEIQVKPDEALQASINCYLSQFLESPINASAFLMNILYR